MPAWMDSGGSPEQAQDAAADQRAAVELARKSDVAIVFVGTNAAVEQEGHDRKSLGPKMTGGRVAGPIWAAAFRKIMKIPGRTWKKTFDPPSGDVEYCNICAKTGKRY